MIFFKNFAIVLATKASQCVQTFFDTAVVLKRKTVPGLVLFVTVASACAETPRTATNFCRQLALEVPAITQPTATPAEVSQMLDRYKRLGKVAPLAVEKDWQALTELLTVASRVNPNDAESVQAVVDMSYATEKSAAAAAKWIRETCGVDISTGLSVGPTP